jgi:hypothetical protein
MIDRLHGYYTAHEHHSVRIDIYPSQVCQLPGLFYRRIRVILQFTRSNRLLRLPRPPSTPWRYRGVAFRLMSGALLLVCSWLPKTTTAAASGTP